jgi:hypothetical protein
LRFGARAKKIKNKARINKELSIAELKHMLEKMESELESKNRRIRLLEKMIRELGGEVPAENVRGPDKSSPVKQISKIKKNDDEDMLLAKLEEAEK